jgi:hypothetical protein
LSNARNRRVLRGQGKRADGVEPVRLNTRVGTRLEPGQTRWTVIEELLGQAGYLAWSAGDSAELVIGQPNYDQEVQFELRRPGAAAATFSGWAFVRAPPTATAPSSSWARGAFNAFARTFAYAYRVRKMRPDDVRGLSELIARLEASFGAMDISVMSRNGNFDVEPFQVAE